MNEPGAIYGFQMLNLRECPLSLTQKLILCHAREALKACLTRIEQLREHVASSQIKNAAYDPKIHTLISDLCYQTGVASNILFVRNKPGSASPIAKEMAMERTKYIQTVCEQKNVKCPTLRDREIRNALTHIDERLADAMTKQPNIGWYVDTALNPLEWKPHPNIKEHRYCRCYDISRDRILHLGHELDLASLEQECRALIKSIFDEYTDTD